MYFEIRKLIRAKRKKKVGWGAQGQVIETTGQSQGRLSLERAEKPMKGEGKE